MSKLPEGSAIADERPNFLFLCTDQMRADHLGCDGNPAIHTPCLDRLAGEGVHLRRAYVNCPLCMPSRSTWFTGLTPRGHGVRTNGIPLHPTFPTVPGALARAGYQTGAVGKIHLSNFMRHPEVPLGSLPPSRFPELIEHWQAESLDHVPTPYHGLQHVDITLGHGSKVDGNYARWLQREHPDAWKALRSSRPHPSPLGAEGCATYALPEELHHTAYVADRTIEFLRHRETKRPFFLMCSFPDPHHPYHVPAPWDRMYAPDNVVPPVARERELDALAPFFRDIYEKAILLSGRRAPTKMPDDHRREILAHTYGMVSLIDKHVGRVLEALDELGLRENTVVLFTSDHGDLMGDHGLLNKGPFHFEGLLRVPMLWRCPGRFRKQSSDGLASLLDVAPTILELAGVPIPEGPTSPEAPQQPPAWPGRSLVPLLKGHLDAVQDSVVVENDEDYLGLRLRTLVTPTHKITTYTGHRGPEPYGELFDLTEDPGELRNLWDAPGHAEVKRDLIGRLHHRLAETDIALPRRLGHA